MTRWGLLLVFWLPGVSFAGGAVSEITYMDQAPKGGGYVTRYLVSDDFLRMDFGRDRDDYVLYDRHSKRIFNVTHDARQVLVIDAAPVSYPLPKEWSVREHTLQRSEGKRRFEISVNGETCMRVMAMERFLPEVNAALGEFAQALAATQADTFRATPPEMQQSCELMRYVLEPTRLYQFGLPVDEVHHDGLSRRMLNSATDVKPRPGLFDVPPGYRQISLKEMRGG